MDLDLTDRVALVTGGGSGIGAACARELAGSGARVVVADLRFDAARAVAEDIGDRAVAVAADVADPDAAGAMVAAALDRFGRLDIAVNSAGLGAPELVPLGEASWVAWPRVTAVNLDGMFLSMRAQLAAMGAGGAVVNVASVMEAVATPGGGGYVAAKHGVVGLTKVAALDYAPLGIRVNAVGPAFVDTPMLAPLPGPAREALVAAHPIGRLGRPEEVAAVVVSLASPAASFVTGAFLPVDGGYLTR